VWRVQLELETCNSNNAETDNSVSVSLNASNSTWLDYPGDDFARGARRTYDLKLDGIGTLEDITRLRVTKTGGDRWCIESLSLRVNRLEIFRSTTDRTLTSGDSARFTISSDTMRDSQTWEDWVDPTALPLTFTHSELESRIGGIIGDAMHGNVLMWGGKQGDRYVDVSRRDSDEVRVDLDLEADVIGDPFDDPNVDVDFFIRFSCADGVVSITPRAFAVSVSWPLDGEDAETILDGIVAAATPLSIDMGFCPTITIDDDGDVTFDF
jgi:hypothetical protein